MIYAGTAAGHNSAHSKKFLPIKLYLVTTHAEETPKIILRIPTPIMSTIVL